MSTLEIPRGTAGVESSTNDVSAQVRVDEPSAVLEVGSFALTVEQCIYLIIGVVALLAHVWGLGDRALHHDETLHAAYSWTLFTGGGYIHDPLLHGPFLYHIGALFYFLFGDNDFTARLSAALFGTALTLLPYLVRRELGRPAALIASMYLLLSPAFLYVGRFFRHDIYSIFFEMLVFVAVVRYASTRRPRWLYIGVAAFGLMLVNQETSYLFLLIMGAPLLFLLLWRVFKPGVVILGGLAVVLALLVFVLPGTAQVDGAHNAIRNPETGQMEYTPGPLFGWHPLETEDNAYALRIRNRADTDGGRSLFANIGQYFADLGKFFGHPAIITGIGLVIASLLVIVWFIWIRRDSEGLTAWQRALVQEDKLVMTYTSLAQDRRWLTALAILLLIYTLFFTAFLTNLLGLVTGTTGSLLYWLAQHNVERGGQPDHYYSVLLLVYEPLIVLFGSLGGILVAIDLFTRWRNRRAETPRAPLVAPHSLFAVYLLVWWSLAALGIYTWAGEKMPWLLVHIALPLVLFAAWAAQRMLAPVMAAASFQDAGTRIKSGLVFTCAFTVIVTFGYLLMTAYVTPVQSTTTPSWLVLVFVFMLLGILIVAAGLYWNWRWSFSMLALCVMILGGLYTVRSSYRLSYLSGDVPREMLIYTQTSPDVVRVIRRLEEASRRRGGGLDMPVLYDNETVWTWYLRDFTSATRVGPQLTGPPGEEVQAVLMLQENLDQYPQNRDYLQGFQIQRLPLRWWFPEEQTYRLRQDWATAPLDQVSLLGQALRAPFNAETTQNLWDFLIRRDPGAPLGSTDFVIAVRPLLADQIGVGVGGALNPQHNTTNP
ncbi:MAG: TIGR03663 family protein [Chloroflexales bacterium]|nr:TIGR03663 family protein [Chloroflexales bacterium]